MPDILEKLSDNIKRLTIETCAKVAEIFRIKGPIEMGSYHDGYNAAVRDIAAKIRELSR